MLYYGRKCMVTLDHQTAGRAAAGGASVARLLLTLGVRWMACDRRHHNEQYSALSIAGGKGFDLFGEGVGRINATLQWRVPTQCVVVEIKHGQARERGFVEHFRGDLLWQCGETLERGVEANHSQGRCRCVLLLLAEYDVDEDGDEHGDLGHFAAQTSLAGAAFAQF